MMEGRIDIKKGQLTATTQMKRIEGNLRLVAEILNIKTITKKKIKKKKN